MADSPNASPQVHVVGHASPPPPAPNNANQRESLPAPSRGPRTLLLRRGENGFGFTLRHFIVYPPESCYQMLPGHERARIDEPMDTIFVKQVRANSPASEAGLRTGDRVASVDGVPTRGEQYARVVQRIQQAGPWLRLIVVSKDDDILQRYFGETAHNPETNQRPRLRSPDRTSQKQRRSTSMIPGPTPRSRQSWVCSPPGSENQGTTLHPYKQQREEVYKDTKMLAPTQRRPLEAHNQETLYDHPERPQRRQKEQQNQIPQPFRQPPDSRFDLYDRTRPESIYSRPSNTEQIYDRIKDPIYERVRPSDVISKSLDQYPMSRAEPQVPIYRPGRRVVSRRASEGSGMASELESQAYGSMDALKSSTPGSRLSMESRRDSSPASKESLSSYDSNSTLTGNEYSDDSVIMNRLRRSFEQKEEFLRRPSQPIGWLTPEEESKRIQREFYARPQKLQRQVWPPNEQQASRRQHSPTRNSVERNTRAPKPTNQSLQRVRGDLDSETEYSNQLDGENDDDVDDNDDDDEDDGDQPGIEEIQAKRDQFYSSLYDSNGQFVKENHFKYGPPVAGNNGNKINNDAQFRSSNTRSGNKAAFVTTLSRIHENVTSNQQGGGQDLRNGTSSLPSSPGPEKKNNDKFSVPPQGLQIVSRRAKQFESGRLLSDDDEPTSDRTNLYKSELSRLSSKRSVPNVAVRKREFESKAEAREPRRIPAHRESKSLESGRELSGNRVIPVGSKYIHCEPPAGYREIREMPAMETESMHLRARSNSAESWEAANSTSRRNARHTWQTEVEEEDAKRNKAKRQDSYLQAVKAQLDDEDRATRRVSYLKATWSERMHVDSDLELSDSEPVLALRSNSIAGGHSNSSGTVSLKDAEPVEREGPLHVKYTVLEGKRSTDRSWKQVWGVLRGPILYFYKDRHSQSPSSTGDGDAGQNVDVRCSLVDVAEDYTKRKHVLRVANPAAEVLLQSEDAASMALWLRALHKHAATEKSSDTATSTSKQQAVPQTPGPTTPSATAQGSQRSSPLPSHKGIRKFTSFRNRSPTGQSPVNKTRKPSQTMENLPSPKSKTWKGRVAKQLRRMHGQAESPSSPTSQLPPEGATFKIPLELCRPSTFSEYVPLIVEMCTRIVEERGLEVIGIYRVPGNTAAISQLTESVNKGFQNINLQDPRWSDVNVISSLLKSFFRQLPDSLLTADLYPMFIDADKIEDPQRRMATIRKLLRDLPEHHFETLKYLLFHLKKIVEHSEVNKMEAKNLAIVFGPTLVRASGSRDNMVTMVTDMSHQCRIVESLLNNVDWFFSEEDLDDLSRLSVNLSLPADGSEVEPTSIINHNLLLNNIHKVEGMREMVSARDIVSSIISAANRKIQRRRKGQDEPDNEEHDDDKSRTQQQVENSAASRQSMAMAERQCTVSEMVSMHENKSQSNQLASSSGSNTNFSGNSSATNSTLTQPQYSTSQQIGTTTSSESPRISDDVSQSTFDTISNISNFSNDTKQSNDEVAIRTYAGLSATTQERIRKFEQETKAMLQRDQPRQRREAEKREEERKRIEMEWQLAKQEMENDDLLDNIVVGAVTPTFFTERLSSSNTRLSGRSIDVNDSCNQSRATATARILPISVAVQQQPTSQQKAQASSQLSSILGEKMNNGVVKKFKTDKEPSMDSLYLPPARYGSLDSLHEVHSHTSLSPSHQHRGLPGDVSDDGSDLLTSLTSTFDRKWKSLVNPPSQLTPSDPPPNKRDSSCNNCSTNHQPAEVYRDPSLHKTSTGDKIRPPHTKNDIPEKDTDSSVISDPTTPDNDRTIRNKLPETNITVNLLSENNTVIDAAEKDENPKKSNSKTDVSDLPYSSKVKRFESISKVEKPKIQSGNAGLACSSDTKLDEAKCPDTDDVDTSYSNKLQKFESLSKSNSDTRSRLKRSESLNKKSDNVTSKLKRSESLNKHSDRLASPTNSKLKRSESLNKHSDRSESPNSKLKRSESLTKTEKTECNISKRRQSVRKEGATKLKRKNGMPERSIKRRHTVGGTKDFDKVHWLDNKLQTEAEKVIKNDSKPTKSQLRTSSPDLSSNRVNVADTSFLIEVSFRGPSNVVFNVTNARPQSLPDANLASKVFKVPLESHV
ncbi:rho GTPase-activating protein 23 isoform X11 [Neodiprion pinetum]|uniref:rho GTPase-activating protein 23 isoform X11 n=1 Tax=Neodiprion pinetum TaxID=441929 RepID=UPI003722788F